MQCDTHTVHLPLNANTCTRLSSNQPNVTYVHTMIFSENTDTHTHILPDTHTHILPDPHTHRHAYTQTRIHTDTHTHRHAYTQTRIHSDTHTHRHAYTQTRIHTDTHTHRNAYRHATPTYMCTVHTFCIQVSHNYFFTLLETHIH